MPDRHTDQDRWEIYLLQILLVMRPFIFVGAVILLVYALAAWIAYPIVSGVAFILGVYLALVVISYRTALYTARLGAWLATRGSPRAR